MNACLLLIRPSFFPHRSPHAPTTNNPGEPPNDDSTGVHLLHHATQSLPPASLVARRLGLLLGLLAKLFGGGLGDLPASSWTVMAVFSSSSLKNLFSWHESGTT
jgi:hypothetical protein